MSSPANPPRAVNRWLVLVVVCFAQFMVVLDGTVVNVALPSIQKDLGFQADDLAWVINAYTLIFGGFLLLGGRAADLFGRKKLFVAGVTLFSVASLLDGLASSPGQLIAFRALQGLGGALVSPAAMSIITTTFDEGPDRTKALGVWAAIAGVGLAFGLIIGGVIVQALSWPWIFALNVPIGVLVVLAALRLVPESRVEDAKGGFDLFGALTVTGGLVSLVYAIVEAGSKGWGSTQTLGFGALAIILIAAFITIERRHSAPLVRLSIFRIRTLVTANSVMLFTVSGMFAMFFFTTLYLQQVNGYSPIKTGLAFLPFTFGIMAGSAVAEVAIKRIGMRACIVGGLSLASVALLLMLRIHVDGNYFTEMFPAMVVLAGGVGLVFVPLTLLATTGIEGEDQGLASGLFNTSQQFGGALGLAILSTFAASETTRKLKDFGSGVSAHDHQVALVSGYHLAYAIGAGLMAIAAVIALVSLRGDALAAADLAAEQQEHPVLVA
jgi:EmrB/QacA subfamily drug resistance transporter